MRTPSYEEYRAAGHDHATAQALVGIDGDCEKHARVRAALRRMPAKARRNYATYLRTGRLPEVRARAPREARNDRPRGSRRSSVRRSSERSGDSGSDSDPSEPPPPQRLCAFCGKDLPPERRRYCTDKHADRDRQRRKRARDRERSKLPSSPMPADFWRMCEFAGPVAAWSVGPARPDWVYPASGRHSQSFRFPALGEYEALRVAARARAEREEVAA